jgi:tetratricopeptide (TPR) repeat protein
MLNSANCLRKLLQKGLIVVTGFIAMGGLSLLYSAVRPEIQSIATHYEKGETAQSKALLQSVVPNNPDEQALVYYYKAIFATDTEVAKNQLQLLAELSPQNSYAQKGLLELGQICLLDREYDKALGYFNQINAPDLDEKQFWLARTYFQKGDFSNAVASANQFIRISSSQTKTEDAYFLLADAYINLEQYNNAISSLKKLLSKPDLIENEQYLHYRYGYAEEMLNNRPEALSQYKQGYELDRFSQVAYLIEDRLFNLRSQYGSSIDLNFLYPYSATALPDIVLAELNNLGNANGTDNPDSTKVVKPPLPQEINFDQQQGLYLQAGRFGNQNNAIKLCDKIIQLKLNAQYYKATQYSDISWVVIVGPFQTELEAVNAKTLLRDNGVDSFIIQK